MNGKQERSIVILVKKLLRRTVLIGVPVLLLSIFTFVALNYPPERRGTVLLLASATMFATIASTGGLLLSKLFLHGVTSSRVGLRGKIILLVAGMCSFGIAFGSVALLGYLLGRV